MTTSASASPTLVETRVFVSLESDERIDEHTRDTFSAGWRELYEVLEVTTDYDTTDEYQR